MIRLPPRSTLDRSPAASDVYKGQPLYTLTAADLEAGDAEFLVMMKCFDDTFLQTVYILSLIHISEPTRPY